MSNNRKEWLYRGLRTAAQAAAGVIAANLTAWVSGVSDTATLKNVAVNAGAVIVAAVLAALMNLDTPE